MASKNSTARIAAQAAIAAVEKLEDDADDDRAPLKGSPFFANLDQEESTLDNVLVMRMGPVKEGTLGQISASEGHDEILKRWGGGTFRLVGRDERNRPMKGAFTTIDIAGEPKFKTKLAAQEYARMQRESAGDGGIDLAALSSSKKDSSSGDGLGIKEVLMLMDRRGGEAELAHKREIERLRVEGEQRERERKADDDRRREERKADEERRRDEARERDERDRKHAEEATRRDREFYANMLKMNEHKGAVSDPIAPLMAGVNLAMKLSGTQGESDPSMAFLRAMPDIMKHGAEMFRAGGAGAPAAPAAARPAPAPAEPRGEKKGEVTIAGELGKKAERAIEHLVAQKFDVEAMLDRMFDALLSAQNPNLIPPNTAAAKPAAPAVAASPAPAGDAPKEPPPSSVAPGDAASQLPDEPAPTPPKATNGGRSATP